VTRAWGAAALGVCCWCLIVMAMGLSNAHSVWEWLWTLLFGAVVPVALLRLASGVLTTYQRSSSDVAEELRVLRALSAGELTAATVAVRTSLPLEDVAARLEEMAARGYLDVRLTADGVERYALAGELQVGAAPERDLRWGV